MRIAIVNDTFMAVEVLQRIVSSVPDYKVAWVAYDGIEAVYKCAADTPDLILMDVIMPGMNGVEATRRIMGRSPCAILMVTASVNRYTADVFEAMGYGALDAVNTPVLIPGDRKDDSTRLLKKIATIARLLGKSYCQEFQLSTQQKPSLIVMGASTGGPQALAKILSQFPKDFHAAVVIVQHVDAQFASGFANWLNEQIPMPVKIAIAGSSPEPGQVLVAGGNLHLTMHSDLTLGYHKQPLDCLYRPSVDVFFGSVATHWTGRGVGVLLTGMGRDGARGLKNLRKAGWHTIAQDRQTSVVYGMPKAAAELEAATEILPVDAIASACSDRS